MIKARGNFGNSRDVLLLGLSFENMERLKANPCDDCP